MLLASKNSDEAATAMRCYSIQITENLTLHTGLKELIPDPKPRPAGWLSAAFPLDSTLPEANKCSAGYQVHRPTLILFLQCGNLLNLDF